MPIFRVWVATAAATTAVRRALGSAARSACLRSCWALDPALRGVGASG